MADSNHQSSISFGRDGAETALSDDSDPKLKRDIRINICI